MPDVPRVNWIVRTMAGAGQALYYDTLFRFKQEYTFSIIQTEYITLVLIILVLLGLIAQSTVGRLMQATL